MKIEVNTQQMLTFMRTRITLHDGLKRIYLLFICVCLSNPCHLRSTFSTAK
jgi:hypothetical protein